MTEALARGELGLLVDGIVAILLVATIVYAAILNRKLSQLRAARGEMEQLLAGFSQATARAESSLAALREMSSEAGERLQQDIEKGNAVADDLMFLVERAGGLADRLEGFQPAARAKPGAPAAPPAAPFTAPETLDEAPAPEPGPEAPESAFIKALRGVR